MEELKQLLSCASLALERVAANAEMQRQIQEARIRDLQELVTSTRRERNEAREQLLKLEHSLAEYSVRTIPQQHVMSSDQSQWPDRKLAGADLHVNNSSSHPAWLVDPSPPPVSLADEFCRNLTPTHHFDLGFDIDLRRPPISLNVDFSNSMEIKEQSKQQEEVESHFLASPPSILGCSPAAMPAHLPEPPEAPDLDQVSESALPEKGKLLQAVMQAGPLLQTLLLTGPLPKWKQPPPALDSVDIPRISMCSSNNYFIPMCPLVHHVSTPPHGPADPLPVNSVVSSESHDSLRRIRINKSHYRTAFTTSPRSGSKPRASSSKSLFVPVLNSLDSSKFVKMQ